jgi:hypothetical protein
VHGWPLAFLFFACMNVDAIFLHCLQHSAVCITYVRIGVTLGLA